MRTWLCYFAFLLVFLPGSLTLLAQDEATTPKIPEEKPVTGLQPYAMELLSSNAVSEQYLQLRSVAPNYPLGPGDKIEISIWGDLTLNASCDVSPEGFITIPKINHRIYLNGILFQKLEPLILNELKKFYAANLTREKFASNEVSMAITLASVRGIQVLVAGEVNNPGTHQVTSTSADLLGILAQVGITPLGTMRDIRVIRTDAQVDSVDLYSIQKGESTVERLFLRQGDKVFVPQKGISVILKGNKGDEVQRPAIYEMRQDENLGDLVELAGTTNHADLSSVHITRQRPNKPLEILNVDITTPKGKETRLFDGDQVEIFPVPDEWMDWIVEISGGGIRKPRTYSYENGMTLSKLFELAGGRYNDASNNIILVRTRKDKIKSVFQLDVHAVSPDSFTLWPLDKVTTFSAHTLRGGDKIVSIEGQVRNPHDYTLGDGMRLLDLLFNAGGFDDPDYLKTVYLDRADLIRVEERAHEKKIIPINLRALLQGDAEKNLELQSKDKVVIYKAEDFEDKHSVEISGLVRKPASYSLSTGMTLEDLFVQAHGLEEAADSSYVEVARLNLTNGASGQLAEILKVPMKESSRFKLSNRDIVYVRADPERRSKRTVVIRGEVRYPGEYVLSEKNERLSDLVSRAGGLLETASVESCAFFRRQSTGTVRVAMDIEKALSGGYKEHDIILVHQDSVHVPPKNWVVHVTGAVFRPGFVQWKKGARTGYYVDAVGGLIPGADKKKARIYLPNGFAKKAFRGWPDPKVPAGSTIKIPEVPPKAREE
jgi:polysaccharide biosynthesis/export protein